MFKQQSRDQKFRYICRFSTQSIGPIERAGADYPAKKLKILAVTGTKGKTTSSFLLEHVFKTAGYKTALFSTVKNKIIDQEFPTL